jgi:hypothetical protein
VSLPDWIDDRDLADDGPTQEEIDAFWAEMPPASPPSDAELDDMARRDSLAEPPF